MLCGVQLSWMPLPCSSATRMPHNSEGHIPHPALPPMWLVWLLASLPSAVLVTWYATSGRCPWVPPEAHTDTGRLCSAGSRDDPVPRRHRSYAALRLPASVGHGSGSPCQWPPSWRTLVLCLVGRRHVRPPTCRASETGHRLSRTPECLRGEARASQVARPSSSYVLWSNTPPDTAPSSPNSCRGPLLPSIYSSTLGIREDDRFRGRNPTARTFACLRIADAISGTVARLATGWAGSPLAGRDSHPLDDRQSFMEDSRPPIPIDPQGLVALKSLSMHMAYSR